MTTDNESDDDIEEIRAVQAKEAIQAVKTLRQYCENQNDGYQFLGSLDKLDDFVKRKKQDVLSQTNI